MQTSTNPVQINRVIDTNPWIYHPADDNPEVINGKDGLATLKRVAQKLPRIDIPMDKNSREEYPAVASIVFSQVGLDYHLNREVFVIGGHLFFRRYNDDWNPSIMYKSKPGTWEVGGCPSNFIYNLEKMLENKSFDQVTYEDIQSLLKKK